MSASEQKTKTELTIRNQLAQAKNARTGGGIIAQGPALPGKTTWVEVATAPAPVTTSSKNDSKTKSVGALLFSSSEHSEQRIFFRFFRKTATDKLTKAQAIERVKAFCVARQNYHLGLVNLFTKGRGQDIQDYYSAIGLTESEWPSTDTKTREHFAKVYGIFVTDYTNLLNLLNRHEIEAALVLAYQKQLTLQIAYDSVPSKSKISYQHKQHDFELPYFIEMVKFLKSYTNSLLFQKIEVYYLVFNSDPIRLEIRSGYNFVKYLQDALNLIAVQKLRLKQLDNDDPAKVLPSHYTKRFRSIIQKNNEAFNDVQNRVAAIKSLPKPGTAAFTNLVKISVSVDRIVQNYKELADTTTAVREKILIIRNRIQQLTDENTTALQALTQQINNIFEGEGFGSDPNPDPATANASANSTVNASNKNEALQKQKEKIIGPELENLRVFYFLLNLQLQGIVQLFDGNNIETVQDRLEDITEEFENLKVQGQLLLGHVKGSAETFVAKQQAQNAAKDAEEKAKEAENEKRFAEATEAYAERTRQHKSKAALAKEAKDKLREEQRRLEAAKRTELDRQAAMEEKRKGELSEIQLRDFDLNDTQIGLIQSIFSEPVPHHVIKYKEVVNLIEALGGEVITSGGGSHRHVNLVCLKNAVGFVDYHDVDNDAAKPSIASGTLVRPHGRSHNSGTLSQFAVKQFREVLERTGLKLSVISHKEKSNPRPTA